MLFNPWGFRGIRLIQFHCHTAMAFSFTDDLGCQWLASESVVQAGEKKVAVSLALVNLRKRTKWRSGREAGVDV